MPVRTVCNRIATKNEGGVDEKEQRVEKLKTLKQLQKELDTGDKILKQERKKGRREERNRQTTSIQEGS